MPAVNAQNCGNLALPDSQKDLFFATLVHDLKNPIKAQLSGLNLLAGGTFGGINDKQMEIINLIKESVSFMSEMLYSVLDVYKYENGNKNLDKSIFDIKEMTKCLISEFSFSAKERGLNFILNSKQCYIHADKTKIRRLITNLMTNAVNYSYRNSNIEINIYTESEKLIFKIKNTGKEISDELKEHIFDKYSTGSMTGTGLGLYYCKETVTLHGGNIYVNSVGNTTEFEFILPVDIKLSEIRNPKCS